MNLMTSVVVALVMAGMGSTALAEDVASPQERRAEVLELLADLDIQPGQKSEIAKILKEHRPEIKVAADALAEARKDLFAAVHADVFSESAVRRAHKTVAAAEENVVVLRARLVQEVRGVLTEKQRAELQERRAAAADRIERRAGILRQVVDLWIENNLAG